MKKRPATTTATMMPVNFQPKFPLQVRTFIDETTSTHTALLVLEAALNQQRTASHIVVIFNETTQQTYRRGQVLESIRAYRRQLAAADPRCNGYLAQIRERYEEWRGRIDKLDPERSLNNSITQLRGQITERTEEVQSIQRLLKEQKDDTINIVGHDQPILRSAIVQSEQDLQHEIQELDKQIKRLEETRIERDTLQSDLPHLKDLEEGLRTLAQTLEVYLLSQQEQEEREADASLQMQEAWEQRQITRFYGPELERNWQCSGPHCRDKDRPLGWAAPAKDMFHQGIFFGPFYERINALGTIALVQNALGKTSIKESPTSAILVRNLVSDVLGFFKANPGLILCPKCKQALEQESQAAFEAGTGPRIRCFPLEQTIRGLPGMYRQNVLGSKPADSPQKKDKAEDEKKKYRNTDTPDHQSGNSGIERLLAQIAEKDEQIQQLTQANRQLQHAVNDRALMKDSGIAIVQIPANAPAHLKRTEVLLLRLTMRQRVAHERAKADVVKIQAKDAELKLAVATLDLQQKELDKRRAELEQQVAANLAQEPIVKAEAERAEAELAEARARFMAQAAKRAQEEALGNLAQTESQWLRLSQIEAGEKTATARHLRRKAEAERDRELSNERQGENALKKVVGDLQLAQEQRAKIEAEAEAAISVAEAELPLVQAQLQIANLNVQEATLRLELHKLDANAAAEANDEKALAKAYDAQAADTAAKAKADLQIANLNERISELTKTIEKIRTEREQAAQQAATTPTDPSSLTPDDAREPEIEIIHHGSGDTSDLPAAEATNDQAAPPAEPEVPVTANSAATNHNPA